MVKLAKDHAQWRSWLDQPSEETLPSVLNALLGEPRLYDAQAVRGLRLSDEVREYIRVYGHSTPIALVGDDLRRFNRRLLEDAYPDGLESVYRLRMGAIIGMLHETPRAALCLSGGGIRSGTFSLGVLQGLARRGLLDKFHYLSTVSGGGYIGGWLTAWIHRHRDGLHGVIEELRRQPDSKLEPEPEPVRHLREYSNFVAPRPSLISADVWSFVSIYVRNLLINWSALIPLLASVLLLPRVVVALLCVNCTTTIAPWEAGFGAFLVGSMFSMVAIFYITINRPTRADALAPGTRWRELRGQGAFLRYSLLPTVVAGLWLSTFWAWYQRGFGPPGKVALMLIGWGQWALTLVPPPLIRLWQWASALIPPPYGLLVVLIMIGLLFYLVALAVAFAVLWRWPHVSDLLAAVFTSVGGGLFTWVLLVSAFPEPTSIPFPEPTSTQAWPPLIPALYGCLAVPAYLLVFFGSSAVFVAATSKRRTEEWKLEEARQWRYAIEDEDREWLGRHGGWLFIMSLAWMVVSALVIFGPSLLLWAPRWLAACGSVSGVIAILGGKSALTTANDKNRVSARWTTLLAEKGLAIAAMLFLAIMVAALSLVSSWGIRKLMPPPPETWRWATGEVGGQPAILGGQLAILYGAPLWLIALLVVVLAGLGLLFASAINLNKFSLHGAYRARIMRAFLGASRTTAERVPNPFTGFDPQDNIQMHELWPGLLREVSFKPGGLVGFVVKLRDHKDPKSHDLHAALSPSTQALLGNHRGKNPPSQSLKRSLLEDVNRLLNGNPGLVGLPSFAEGPSDEARPLIDKLRTGRADKELDGLFAGAPRNRELAERLKKRRGLMLALNRKALDAVYEDEIEPIDEPPPPYRLLHVVGTALNLVGGKRLAWQQRRAESFTTSPLHCGSLYRGYRRSRGYGGADGISLGTAMTISGAAVSSNMGYHSASAAVTMALTLFNARLGWWLGNPGAAGGAARRDHGADSGRAVAPYQRSFPRLSLAPLCLEAFGLTDDTSKYVLLSDGGHFDNLGLYEMVLRRCRFIVVVDGSQDAKARFDDLGAAIRKIRVDLGIEIAFEQPFQIYHKNHPDAKAGKYCAVGTIRYSALDKSSSNPSIADGVLLYVKPAIRGDEPRDVLQYSAANDAFPHQSTVDQFFDESQFESYRTLGLHVMDKLGGRDTQAKDGLTCGDFMMRVWDGHLSIGAPPDGKLRDAIMARVAGL